jgi:L-alanine-DL-glutamate epimerase-like enolase superfamily enzyme
LAHQPCTSDRVILASAIAWAVPRPDFEKTVGLTHLLQSASQSACALAVIAAPHIATPASNAIAVHLVSVITGLNIAASMKRVSV